MKSRTWSGFVLNVFAKLGYSISIWDLLIKSKEVKCVCLKQSERLKILPYSCAHVADTSGFWHHIPMANLRFQTWQQVTVTVSSGTIWWSLVSSRASPKAFSRPGYLPCLHERATQRWGQGLQGRLEKTRGMELMDKYPSFWVWACNPQGHSMEHLWPAPLQCSPQKPWGWACTSMLLSALLTLPPPPLLLLESTAKYTWTQGFVSDSALKGKHIKIIFTALFPMQELKCYNNPR